MTLTADQTSTGTGSSTRQRVLALYLANSSLDSHVIAWGSWDGTGRSRPTAGDSDEPPYDTGVAALLDGWRLFQVSPLQPPTAGQEFTTSFLKHEFFFEKLEQV